MTANNRFFKNLIFKSLRYGFTRVSVILVSIMLGACVTAAFVNVYLDIDSKVSKELKSYGANMIFAPASPNIDVLSEAEFNEKIAKIPKEKLVAKSGYLFVQVSIGTTNTIAMGMNFGDLDKQNRYKIKPFLDIKNGQPITFELDDRSALIGTDLAKKSGFKVGDEIEVRLIGANESRKLKIRGEVQDGDKEDSLLIISLSLAQKIANLDDKISYAEAVVSDKFDYISNLSKELSDDNFAVRPVAKVSKSEGLILDKIKLLMALVSLVILLITSMCVNTTLSAILLSRSREIALLRALGASRRNVLNLFGIETLLTALFAAFIGSLLGFLLAQILGFAIFGSSIDFRILSVPLAMIISLIFAFIAAFYPMQRALGTKMADILRGE
jgi:hydrogenase 4 membrane subunit